MEGKLKEGGRRDRPKWSICTEREGKGLPDFPKQRTLKKTRFLDLRKKIGRNSRAQNAPVSTTIKVFFIKRVLFKWAFLLPEIW